MRMSTFGVVVLLPLRVSVFAFVASAERFRGFAQGDINVSGATEPDSLF